MFSLPKNIINEILSKCIFYYNEVLLPQQPNSRKIIFKYSNYNGLLFIQQLYKKEKNNYKTEKLTILNLLGIPSFLISYMILL